jgi:hypothetical protein
MEADLGGGGAPKRNAVAARRRTLPVILPTTIRPSPDVFGVGALLALTVIVAWDHLAGSGWALLRLDALNFFIPMWGHLGERLRAGDIPGWSPHQFGGAPFAGDPESGWMYLPAMVAATLLLPVAAFKAVVVFHLALAGLATYAFGRALGMGALGSLVAGTAYEFGALLEFTRCCTPFVQVGAWFPLALLGVELGLRAGAWLPRVGWWGVAGFAISQLLAGWIGQGSYYGLLVVGGYLAYRTLIASDVTGETVWSRLGVLVTHGAAVLAIGFGLAAAGLLPRLEAIGRSTLAGGSYDGLQGDTSGPTWWSIAAGLDYVLSIDAVAQRYYAGGVTLALALLAPLLARRRFATPFFAAMSVVAFTLTLRPTPLHWLFALLPRFQTLHEHYPERVLVVFYFGLAMLAGATVAMLPRWRAPALLPLLGVVPFFSLVVAKPWLERAGLSAIASSTLWAVGLVALVLAGMPLMRPPWPKVLLPALLVVLVFADPTGWSLISQRALHRQVEGEAAALYTAYGASGGAASFLLARQGMAPVRYAGYDFGSMEPGNNAYFRTYRLPLVPALLVNNRATSLELHDLSGYNPVQPARFRALVDGLNRGQTQNYHQTNLLPGGLDSPVLDLLNVRYIVIPAAAPAERWDLHLLAALYPTVYEDDEVRVVENRDALPRAWIVHEAVTVTPAAALAMVSSRAGIVDTRRTAVLETEPPPLAQPADPTADDVAVMSYASDRIQLTARSSAPGLVVLSDTYDAGWRAYVDGEPAPVLVANYALRGVPMPAGEHTIELRYEPRSLTVGLAISLGTGLLLLGTLAALSGARWRRSRLDRQCKDEDG